MAYKIEDIEGIGPAYGAKLQKVGIKTTEQLLSACATKKGRKDMADKTGIAEALILTWTNHADLFRIKGVATQFSELLEASGVDTVKEFRNRVAANLHPKMVETNAAKKLTRRIPSVKQLTKMIEAAKALTPKMEY